MSESFNRELASLVRRFVPSERVKDVRVFVDRKVKDAGVPVRIGLGDVEMPFRGVVVFVDLQPEANWGHPVAYLLASPDLKRWERYEEYFPPFSGTLPENWCELRLSARS